MNVERLSFATRQEYARCFTNPSYWQAYVAAICTRHELGECTTVRAGFPGTNPVFIVNETYVIKLYSDLFDGERSFLVEHEVYRLIATQPDLPAPSLVASGELFDAHDGWSWPYIVTQIIPGLSMSESELSDTDRLAIATWLGPVVRRLHALPLVEAGPLLPRWEPFLQFLAEQRAEVVNNHVRWGVLPAHLVAQIERYLPDLTELIDTDETPALIHCDLTSDHVLGESITGHWQPSGIIDFGDAKVGDRMYELVALHLGLFDSNRQLLWTFLDAYGFDTALQRDFVRKAMSMTLLFEFNVCSHIFKNIPAAASASTLEELAELLWGRALTSCGCSEVFTV
ncbi:MAG TPA: aminoglycoside phosphotransferase family protein [Ktedonobacteraceae bacterium]|nr:aminoglycoside phosphotransferase family protein [Ktedonobacteraceae bacterium]